MDINDFKIKRVNPNFVIKRFTSPTIDIYDENLKAEELVRFDEFEKLGEEVASDVVSER